MLGTVVIICWAILWCFPIFTVLKRFGILRVPLEMELAGMDGPKHNERAYPASAWQEEADGPSSMLDKNKILGNNWMPHTKIGPSLSANLTLSNTQCPRNNNEICYYFSLFLQDVEAPTSSTLVRQSRPLYCRSAPSIWAKAIRQCSPPNARLLFKL